MTTPTQQWSPASDDMAWDDKPFGDQKGLMDIERSVPQNKRSRRVGQGPSTDVDEAMKQLGYLVAGKLHRDISKVDRLIHPQSAADWLKEKKLDKKGWTVSSEDLDNDAS
ncbi:MAG: hypothetical protein EZS28_037170, partial [Streblomastix strix]